MIRKRPVQHERAIQTEFFQLCNAIAKYNDLYELVYHIPNGGSRNFFEAVNLKRSGLKAGIPDVHVPISRCGYHSLYIEFKSDSGRVGDKQEYYIEKLKREGNKVIVARSSKEAFDVLQNYINNRDVLMEAPQKKKRIKKQTDFPW